jgi:hypothetical protein
LFAWPAYCAGSCSYGQLLWYRLAVGISYGFLEKIWTKEIAVGLSC